MSDYINKIIRSIKHRCDDFTKKNRYQVYELANNLVTHSNAILVPKSDNTIRTIELEDVYYVEERKKGFVFIHTLNETVEYTNKACNLLDHVEMVDSDFRYLNKGLVVNITKILKYNSYQRKVYFSSDLWVYTTGAAINTITKLLGKEMDEYYDIDVKYGIYEC